MTENPNTGFSTLDEKLKQQQLKLPFWKNEHRAMPNHIARSALFIPIQKGPREFHNKQIISSRCDVEITYTGLQLDESDADLWMLLLHCNRNKSSEYKHFIYRSELLSELGKTTGKESYIWLDESMARLHGSISVKSKRYKVSTTLLQIYAIDEETNRYYFQIDKYVAKLFSNREFSLIEWDKRKKLKYALSKFLQRQIATSSTTEQNFSYIELKSKLKRSGEIKYLKRDLKKACTELFEKKIIFKYELYRNKLKIWRQKLKPS